MRAAPIFSRSSYLVPDSVLSTESFCVPVSVRGDGTAGDSPLRPSRLGAHQPPHQQGSAPDSSNGKATKAGAGGGGRAETGRQRRERLKRERAERKRQQAGGGGGGGGGGGESGAKKGTEKPRYGCERPPAPTREIIFFVVEGWASKSPG